MGCVRNNTLFCSANITCTARSEGIESEVLQTRRTPPTRPKSVSGCAGSEITKQSRMAHFKYDHILSGVECIATDGLCQIDQYRIESNGNAARSPLFSFLTSFPDPRYDPFLPCFHRRPCPKPKSSSPSRYPDHPAAH